MPGANFVGGISDPRQLPGQGSPGSIVPGSFKSNISLGTRYVPAPTPWQAAWNTLLRNYTPHGPFFVDEPPTGVGGRAGKVSSIVPYVGGGLQAIHAGVAAGKKQGQMVSVPPATGFWQNLLTTLGNILALVPGPGVGVKAAKAGVGALSGLAGAPEFFGTSWADMLARGAGMGVRQVGTRVGRAFSPSTPSGARGQAPTAAPTASPEWATPTYATGFPFVPGESIVGRSFGTPVGPYNPFVNPATGLAPSWSLFPGEQQGVPSSFGYQAP